jgi:hypothetical protein
MNEVKPRRVPLGLTILTLLLLVVHPLLFALSSAVALPALPIRGWPLALALVVRFAVAALGIAAGRALQQRRPGARTITLAALTLSCAVDVFVRVTSYVPMNRVPGDAPFYVAALIVYYTGLILYLTQSTSVRNALLPDPPLSTSRRVSP